MTPAAMQSSHSIFPSKRCWGYVLRTSAGCLAAGFFLLSTADTGNAQSSSYTTGKSIPATRMMPSGVDAIPNNLPVHASGTSPINQPLSLLPGTIPDHPISIEDVDLPSLAEQYRLEKQGIRRAPQVRSTTKSATPKTVVQKTSAQPISTATARPMIGTETKAETKAETNPGYIAPETGSNYIIQLGAFHDAISAQSYWASFMVRYPDLVQSHPRSLSTADLGTKGTYHRLRLGGFADFTSAQAKCRQLLADGTDCFATKNR